MSGRILQPELTFGGTLSGATSERVEFSINCDLTLKAGNLFVGWVHSSLAYEHLSIAAGANLPQGWSIEVATDGVNATAVRLQMWDIEKRPVLRAGELLVVHARLGTTPGSYALTMTQPSGTNATGVTYDYGRHSKNQILWQINNGTLVVT